MPPCTAAKPGATARCTPPSAATSTPWRWCRAASAPWASVAGQPHRGGRRLLPIAMSGPHDPGAAERSSGHGTRDRTAHGAAGPEPPGRRARPCCPSTVAAGTPRRSFDGAEPAGAAVEVLPDAVHVPRWLDLPAQQQLATAFREWARPPAGLRHPRMPTGHLMTRAVGVPRLALAALRLHPHRRRHRRRPGEAAAGRPGRPRPRRGRRRLRRRRRLRARRRDRQPLRPRRPARPALRRRGAGRRAGRHASASATPACSASPAWTGGRRRSSTSGCTAAICSSSAGRRGASTTACRRCCAATAPAGLGLPPGPAQHHDPRDGAVMSVTGSSSSTSGATPAPDRLLSAAEAADAGRRLRRRPALPQPGADGPLPLRRGRLRLLRLPAAAGRRAAPPRAVPAPGGGGQRVGRAAGRRRLAAVAGRPRRDAGAVPRRRPGPPDAARAAVRARAGTTRSTRTSTATSPSRSRWWWA